MLSTLAVMVLIVGTPTEPTANSRAPHTGVFGSATVGGGTGLSAAYMALSATVAVDNWTLTTRSADSLRLDDCGSKWCEIVDSDKEQAYLVGRLFPRGSYMGRAALGVGAMTFTRGTYTGEPLPCFGWCSQSRYSHVTSKARGLAWEVAIHLNGGSAFVLGAQGNVNSSNSYAAVSIGFSLGRLSPGRVGGYASRERR